LEEKDGINIHVVRSSAWEIVVAEVVGVEIPHPARCPWRKFGIAFKAFVEILLLSLVRKAHE
jgi:hypothetical protein